MDSVEVPDFKNKSSSRHKVQSVFFLSHILSGLFANGRVSVCVCLHSVHHECVYACAHMPGNVRTHMSLHTACACLCKFHLCVCVRWRVWPSVRFVSFPTEKAN